MTDLRQGVTENQHQVLDYIDTLPAWPRGALEQAMANIKQAQRTTSAVNARVYAQQAAAVLIRWTEQQAASSIEQEGPSTSRKLDGRRRGQLLALLADGAITRESAVAVALQPGHYYPATLSRMVSEGLVYHAYGQGRTEPKRSLFRYWLTAEGLAVAKTAAEKGRGR